MPWIHCIEYIYLFNHSEFWTTCACPKIFHCIEIFLSFRISEELALSLKTEFVMKFFAVFSILFTFRTFEQLLLALENRVCWIHCIECIFYPSEFWTTCACSEKHSLPWKFSLHWNNDFWGTCACSENRDFPEILHFIECSFYIQDFWATCACPEKESVPWIHCIEYIFFIIQNFEQPALAPWKTEFVLKFFTVLKYFLFFNLSFPWKRGLPWIFQAGGAAAASPPRTPLVAST